MSTPVLNNGMFLRDNHYSASSHIDSYHLTNLLKDAKPDDLGPIELWAQVKKIEMPLYKMSSFGGKNVIDIQHPKGEYKWSTPVSEELPHIMEDLDPSNTNKGRDNTPFRIKLNKRAFGHGDIITYDKYNGDELYITNDDIIHMGDGVIYTVTMVNRDNRKPFDNRFLANQTKFFRVSSSKSEHSQRYSDMEMSYTDREFYNYVGQTTAHVHYSVSNKAALMAMNGMTTDGRVPVVEIWKNLDPNMDPSINSLEGMVKNYGLDYVKKAQDNGNVIRTFLTKLEAAHLSKIAYDIENYLMWGKGGRISPDGPDDQRLSVGLWKQLDLSFKKIYNMGDFRLDMFRAEIFNFFNGKVDFDGPDPNRELIVQTGMGGMRLINEAIEKKAFGAGMTIDAKEVGAITGSGMDLGFGFSFTKFTIPFLANVKFVLNPAFDNLQTNDIENPIIEGHRLSSYSFIIFDVTDQGQDNIKLLQCAWNKDMIWRYINGTMDYMGRTAGFQSSSNSSGYEIYMEQAHKAIKVEDPTKVLKIVMRNPITGGSL